MAEKYFFEDKNAKKAASKARTTARSAANTRAVKKTASNGMKNSAASHQRDLAKTSGMTQANNAAATPGRPRRAGTYGDYKKAKAETLKSFGLSTTKAKATTKPAAKPAARSKAGASTVAAVAKRFGVTTREARDIATAVANAASVGHANMGKGTKAGPQTGRMLKDIGKQIKETAVAAKTGKKGTTALRVKDNPKDSFVGMVSKNTYTAKSVKPGTKRK
jgi:hypothetical protein